MPEMTYPGDPGSGDSDAGQRRQRRKPRAPRRINRGYLERAALFYLDRYASSVENLRRVLRRKAARSRAHHGEDGGGDEALIQSVIERLIELDAVDDRRFAEATMRRLRPRGASTRQLRARLRHKGVDAELCDELLGENHAEAELEAGRAYARRRRLGPHRLDPELRAERRQRDLAAMARAGYSFAVASRILDADREE